jgi:hypothetical protein
VEASSFITNVSGWTQIVDVIMADSAYEYLTIGNFRADGATMLLSNPGGGTGVGTYGSYYYIDDVSLINWPLECADPGNIYSFTYNGHDYEIIKEKKVWGMAASCALERGGHLVHIDNAAENAEMIQQITNGANIPANYTVVNDGGGIAYVWIGATDKNAEGLWLWDGDNDNTGLNFWNGQGTAGNGGGSAAGGLYNNWGCSANGCEPDDYAGQDAAGIALAAWPYGDPGEWNDIDLNNQLYYIVEKESNGIGDAARDSGIQLFPNPAHDMIYLRGNIQQSVIRIFSIDGRELYKQNTGNIETTGISISRLAAGMYFVTISCPGNTVSHRFIKE